MIIEILSLDEYTFTNADIYFENNKIKIYFYNYDEHTQINTTDLSDKITKNLTLLTDKYYILSIGAVLKPVRLQGMGFSSYFSEFDWHPEHYRYKRVCNINFFATYDLWCEIKKYYIKCLL